MNSQRLYAHKRFALSLALVPFAASLFFSPLAHAQDATPPAPPSAAMTTTLDTPQVPTAMLLYRCDTAPAQPIGEVRPPAPGDGVTAHVPLPLAGEWCARVLTPVELEITQACVGALQAPGQE